MSSKETPGHADDERRRLPRGGQSAPIGGCRGRAVPKGRKGGGRSSPRGRAAPVGPISKAVGALFVAGAFFFPTTAVSASTARVLAMPTANWSGYGLSGSGFTAVAGTFNVPAPRHSASCLEETAVWVGVDGLDNHDLLQAGIAEAGFTPAEIKTPPYGPSSGLPVACARRALVYAWWEDLPSAPVRVDLPIKVGDSVTVSIFKMSPGWWALAVHDLTNRQSFMLAQPYGGPQTSVEWVVESPQIMGLLRDPFPFGTVHFRDLSSAGEANHLERFSVRSSPDFAAGPDVVASTAQLMQTGFAVG